MKSQSHILTQSLLNKLFPRLNIKTRSFWTSASSKPDKFLIPGLWANHSPSSDHICQCYKLKSNYYICSVKGSLKVVKLISSQNDKVNKHRNFRPFSINFYFLLFPARIQDRNELHESQLRIFNNCLTTNVQNDQTVFKNQRK